MSAPILKDPLRRLKMEIEQETDGRWIAAIPELPGVHCYGATVAEAVTHAEALALRVLADRLEHGELTGDFSGVAFAAA